MIFSRLVVVLSGKSTGLSKHNWQNQTKPAFPRLSVADVTFTDMFTHIEMNV